MHKSCDSRTRAINTFSEELLLVLLLHLLLLLFLLLPLLLLLLLVLLLLMLLLILHLLLLLVILLHLLLLLLILVLILLMLQLLLLLLAVQLLTLLVLLLILLVLLLHLLLLLLQLLHLLLLLKPVLLLLLRLLLLLLLLLIHLLLLLYLLLWLPGTATFSNTLLLLASSLAPTRCYLLMLPACLSPSSSSNLCFRMQLHILMLLLQPSLDSPYATFFSSYSSSLPSFTRVPFPPYSSLVFHLQLSFVLNQLLPSFAFHLLLSPASYTHISST